MKNVPAAPQLRLVGFTFHLSEEEAASGKEWTHTQRVAKLAKAGFHAVAPWPDEEMAALAAKHGMETLRYVDANEKTWKEMLDLAKRVKSARVNVQLCDHDTLPKDAVKVWLKCVKYAKQIGLEIDLEIHRDTATETPEKCWEIARLFKKATGEKIRFCFDFSHLAVVKHLSPPYAARLLDHPDLIRIARQFHFRPFNGHHCQIPVLDAKGKPTPEFEDYLQFMDDLLACWFTGAKGGEVLYICPEVLPKGGYGISTFGPMWADTLYMKNETERLWKKHVRKWRAKTSAR
jgi:hypothetical protein